LKGPVQSRLFVYATASGVGQRARPAINAIERGRKHIREKETIHSGCTSFEPKSAHAVGIADRAWHFVILLLNFKSHVIHGSRPAGLRGSD
jgi:hypothetical protein